MNNEGTNQAKVWIRKIAAILVMILTVGGALLCAGGVLGAWALNGLVTTSVTGVLGMVSNAAGTAADTADTAAASVGDATTKLADIERTAATTRLEGRSRLSARVEELGQPVARVSALAQTAATGVDALNSTLDGMSRVPRLGLVRPGANLEGLSDRLHKVNQNLDALRAAAGGARVEAAPVQNAARALSDELVRVDSQLTEWATRLRDTQATADRAKARAPGVIAFFGWLAVGVCVLLGAGQVSLFRSARRWYRAA